MSEQATGPLPPSPVRTARRWRLSAPWLVVLGAVILVAVVAVALSSPNANVYPLMSYSDLQTDEEMYKDLKMGLFMAHTSGFFWGQFVALFLGVFLAARLPGTSRALTAAVPAGVLLAAVNLAVAWWTAADTRASLAWYAENVPAWGLSADPLADNGFPHMLAATLAGYPLAAVAGVGLGALAAPLLRGPAVATTLLAIVAVTPYSVLTVIFGILAATADDEPVALFGALALLPPAPVIPAVIRSSLDDHGGAFITTMLVSGVVWAALLLTAGRLAESRRARR